ncbi:MAG: iron-containing alcohol dehydrogenase, partial [Erysipelotrichaceae bacterium]|nr:iron-containing alcohol dehydrogenase [Erysipelotrichaceae bacterium]
ESRNYALQGIKLLLSGIGQLNNINEKACDDLYQGSLYGGLAIDVTGTVFAHNVGYYFTENYHLPHGFACALFQEDLFAFEMRSSKDYTEDFFKRIGMKQEEYVELINSLLPENDIVIDEETLAKILPRWKDNGSVKNTLGKMTAEDIEKILRKKFVKNQ